MLFNVFVFAIFNVLLSAEKLENGDDEKYLLDDMLLSETQIRRLFDKDEFRKNGAVDEEMLWPDKKVKFFITEDFNNNQKIQILSALNLISNQTCITFVQLFPGFNEKAYVLIRSGGGCSSEVGYRAGKIQMSLNIEGCLDVGRILHEFLHVLGFYHMHTTKGRDQYVSIAWQNIKPEYYVNFQAYEADTTLLGTTYDFESITHYSPTTFSMNGKPTIVSKIPDTNHLMGQRTHLSKGDILRINRLYNC